MEQTNRQVIFTSEARCRDCYRCVRVCPVKAVKVDGNQARVDDSRCIACGTCVRECPQGAKTYRKDVVLAQKILKGPGLVAASLAPAFAGVYDTWEQLRLPAALRRLGFRYVAETAIGAYLVARETAAVVKKGERTHICTACPAVVNYVEKYDEEKLSHLVPVVSPMMAHARHIKAKFGPDTRVIFIGPCAAKKAEADRTELKGTVDCVLTFEELDQMLAEEGIDLATCEESAFDEQPAGQARFFPIEGGAAATSMLCTDVLNDRLIFVSGFDEFKACLNAIDKKTAPVTVEPLLCPHGCINGPGIKREGNVFERRSRVIRYAGAQKVVEGVVPVQVDLATYFHKRAVDGEGAVTEEKIRHVLEQTSKSRPEQQLDCGACGYPSCREQAAAVVRGMAGTEMCIPYMRRLAEQRTDRIMEASPNGIVVVDRHLNILAYNAAFGVIFKIGPSLVGEHISRVADPEAFERLLSGQQEVFDAPRAYPEHELVLREIVYAMRAEGQFVGMFINITPLQADARTLQKVKDETMLQAQELHAHQMEMAKNFANFLGEYTAKGEQLVNKLLDAVKDQDKGRG
ncbi:MAG: 4Fe-4S binding protein [Candidatus Omnitrophica bacterium]|nr:4Fe-4S binding protein [Candidatus Omnitrophota bacterium]